jgi:hypothetical protein
MHVAAMQCEGDVPVCRTAPLGPLCCNDERTQRSFGSEILSSGVLQMELASYVCS